MFSIKEADDEENPFQRRTVHWDLKELCRNHGVSDSTFYKWRSKCGGMEVSDARILKALDAENAILKKLLAEQNIDVSALKEMLRKNC